MSIQQRKIGVQEAGTILGLGASTVRKLAAEGALDGVKDSAGRWRFSCSELERFRSASAHTANQPEWLPVSERLRDANGERKRIGFLSSVAIGRSEGQRLSSVPAETEPLEGGRVYDWGSVIPSALCVIVCLVFLVLRQFDFYSSKGFEWGPALFCAVIGELFVLYLSYVSGFFSFKKATSWLLVGLVGYLGFILCFNVVQESVRGSIEAERVNAHVEMLASNLALAQSEYQKALVDRDLDLKRVQGARSEKDRVYLRKLMNRPFGSETKLKAAGEALKASQAAVSTAPLAVDPGIGGWLLAVFSVLVLLVNIVAVRNLVSGIA